MTAVVFIRAPVVSFRLPGTAIKLIFSNTICKILLEKIFNFVFYDINKIFMHPAIINSKNNLKAEEEKSFQAFKGTFANILAGDFKKILNRLISSHPYYNGETHSKILIK
jgi:spore coat polysaccharide biosynthesis protein SpsF (cytidylyltransferase family)